MSLQYLADLESSTGQDGENEAIYALHWLEEGILLGGSSRGNLHAWNAQTGQHLGKSTKKAHTFGLKAISSSQNDKIVLTSALDGTVALWDTSDIKKSLESTESTTTAEEGDNMDTEKGTTFPLQYINSLKLGKKEVTVEQDIDEFDEEGEPIKAQLRSCRRPLFALINPTKQEFMTTGPDANLVIRSYDKKVTGEFGEEIACISPPKSNREVKNASQISNEGKQKRERDYGLCMCLHSCGEIVAIGTQFGFVHLFDSKQKEILKTISSGAEPIHCLHFTPDDHLLVGSDNGNVYVYDVRPFVPFSIQAIREEDKDDNTNNFFDDAELNEFADDFQDCQSSQYTTSQASTLSSIFSQSQPLQIQSQSLKPVKSWNSNSIYLTNVIGSHDGRMIATSSLDGHVRIWDFKNPLDQALCNISQDREIYALAWKPVQKENLQDENGERPSKRCKTVQINNGTMTAAAQSAKTASMFVTAGGDGKIRWFRMAGGNTSM